MGRKYVITASYELEVSDEMALRDFGFKARLGNPAFAASYEETDDNTGAALNVVFGHALPTSVPGVRLSRSTVTPVLLDD